MCYCYLQLWSCSGSGQQLKQTVVKVLTLWLAHQSSQRLAWKIWWNTRIKKNSKLPDLSCLSIKHTLSNQCTIGSVCISISKQTYSDTNSTAFEIQMHRTINRSLRIDTSITCKSFVYKLLWVQRPLYRNRWLLDNCITFICEFNVS